MIRCDCMLQQRTDCCVHRRCRELSEQSTRERIELPSVARGDLMLRGGRLGLERKAIVLVVAGQSQVVTFFAQALRATFPRHAAASQSVAQVVVDPDGTLESDEVFVPGGRHGPPQWRICGYSRMLQKTSRRVMNKQANCSGDMDGNMKRQLGTFRSQ